MPIARRILALLGVGVLSAWLSAQAPPSPAPSASAPPNPFLLSPEERARLDQLSREDHADMLRQLGITNLRPGANGRAAAGERGAANQPRVGRRARPLGPRPLAAPDGRPAAPRLRWGQTGGPDT